MALLPPAANLTKNGWHVVADILIATAVIWTLPLLLGLLVAMLTLLRNAI
jgi:hypothetical protein